MLLLQTTRQVAGVVAVAKRDTVVWILDYCQLFVNKFSTYRQYTLTLSDLNSKSTYASSFERILELIHSQ